MADVFDQIHADRTAAKKPTHEAGEVTAWDSASGLPIVKRKTADAPEPKQEPKPDKPAATPEPEQPKTESKPDAKPTLAKGAPVTVNGKSGKVMFVHQEMDIVRVKPDDGSAPITARKSAVKVQPHVVVQSHVRRIPQ